MYSTWFSVLPRGYCERIRREGRALGTWERGFPAERELCCDETPVPTEAVLLLELGFEVRSASGTKAWGGCGEREGREACDISEAERDDGGNDDSDARGFGMGVPGAAGFA